MLKSIAVLLGLAGTALAAPAEIALTGERIFPESLTAAGDGTIIIGSMGGKGIFRAKPGAATAEPWIAPGADGTQAILGVLADDKTGTLWACSAMSLTEGAPAPQSALYAFDLKSGAHKAHYPLPTAGALCNDIVIAADGTLYVADSTNLEIARLPKGGTALETWAGPIGEKGGVVDGIAILGAKGSERVFVNTYMTGKLFAVPVQKDGKAGAPVEIKLPRDLMRPDGMRTSGKSELILAESGGTGRVSRVTIKGNEGSLSVIDRDFPDGVPAVTLAGKAIYALEGQLPKRREPGAKLNPFRAVAIPRASVGIDGAPSVEHPGQ